MCWGTGVSEEPKKSRKENIILTNGRVTKIAGEIGVNKNVKDVQRLGKIGKERIIELYWLKEQMTGMFKLFWQKVPRRANCYRNLV